jgi:hypothetical protein
MSAFLVDLFSDFVLFGVVDSIVGGSGVFVMAVVL